MKYTLPSHLTSRSSRHAKKYGAISFTPAEVSTALRIRCQMSGASTKNFARAVGVSERTLFRSMAGNPNRRAASFLGFERAA